MPSSPASWCTAAKHLNIDVDEYLGPWIPRSRLNRLPPQISRFLGYRDAPQPPIGNIAIAFWAMLGAFCGTAALSGLFMADFVRDKGGPIILGSFGASAILEYNAIAAPLSQPRNQILGQFISALLGVSITKLFALNANFENLRWLAGSLSVAAASGAMTLTNTVHPPGGATALLCAVQADVSGLGWNILYIVLLSSVITTTVACLLNNVHRQFPQYWWSPGEPVVRMQKGNEEENAGTATTEKTSGDELITNFHEGHEIILSGEGAYVPENFGLTVEERDVLKILASRLHTIRKDSWQDSGSETGTSDVSKIGSADSQ